jgi:hypothetical protein
MSSSAIATRSKDDEEQRKDAEQDGDEVKPERVPSDTAAELERVKQLVGANIGIDMRSPGQVKQAEQDEADAQKQLEDEQRKEADEKEKEARDVAAENEKARKESEAQTKVSRSR